MRCKRFAGWSKLKVSKPAITRARIALSEFHLVRRKTDPLDRRSVLAQRTATGTAFFVTSRRYWLRLEVRPTKRLPECGVRFRHRSCLGGSQSGHWMSHRMKNIQVINGALNCTFSLFQATDEEFAPPLS